MSNLLEDPLLTRDEVARMLAVCSHTVMKWDRDGMTKPLRITKRTVRYRSSDIQKMIDSMEMVYEQ